MRKADGAAGCTSSQMRYGVASSATMLVAVACQPELTSCGVPTCSHTPTDPISRRHGMWIFVSLTEPVNSDHASRGRLAAPTLSVVMAVANAPRSLAEFNGPDRFQLVPSKELT